MESGNQTPVNYREKLVYLKTNLNLFHFVSDPIFIERRVDHSISYSRSVKAVPSNNCTTTTIVPGFLLFNV